MNKLFKTTVLLCLVLAVFSSCRREQTAPPAPVFFFSGDTVHVDRESAVFRRLAFATASEQPFARQIEAPANLTFDPTQLAEVIIPFSGRVTRSHVRLGQEVNAGTPLFEIISADFVEAQAEFFQARSEYEVARRNFRRYEELNRNGVASDREVEEARMEYEVAQQEFRLATAVVRVFHPNPENMNVGDPMVIRSPIAGKVSENNIIMGQFIHEEEEAVTIVNKYSMWLEAHVAERDIRFVSLDNTIEFRATAFPDTIFTGTIFYIDCSVDEDTRMIAVKAEVDNSGELLRNGMFATATITGTPQYRIAVPQTAIMQGSRQNFVFVRVGDASFVRRYVTVETIVDGMAMITGGLRAGETIISSGSIYIISDGGFFIR